MKQIDLCAFEQPGTYNKLQKRATAMSYLLKIQNQDSIRKTILTHLQTRS